MANDNPDLVALYEIKQAPTLVIISDGKVEKYANLSNIKAFTERVK
jgi:ribonucleoside-triphosphate reductase